MEPEESPCAYHPVSPDLSYINAKQCQNSLEVKPKFIRDEVRKDWSILRRTWRVATWRQNRTTSWEWWSSGADMARIYYNRILVQARININLQSSLNKINQSNIFTPSHYIFQHQFNHLSNLCIMTRILKIKNEWHYTPTYHR